MKVICDTNIFIHYFNGDLSTQVEINRIALQHILMPSVTKMELFRGMENEFRDTVQSLISLFENNIKYVFLNKATD